MKRSILLIIGLFVFSIGFADGMPKWFYNDDGTRDPYVSKVVVENPVKKLSSYQRLKNKYEAEEAYSDELKDRIVLLQGVVEKKNEDLEKCLSQEPLIIEKTVNDPVFNIIAFITGIIIGVVL